MRRRLTALAAVVVLVVAAVLAVRTLREVRRYRAAGDVCEAVQQGRWTQAVAASDGLAGTDTGGLQAADCRCLALMQLERTEECLGMLEDLLDDPRAGDWLPQPVLVVAAVKHREETGDPEGAAKLAHRGAERYPEEYVLLAQELSLRSRVEDEGKVLEEMEGRLSTAGKAAPLLRLRLARRYLDRERWEKALQLLGEGPTPDPELADAWRRLQVRALGGSGDVTRLRQAFEAWKVAGGDPLELDAHYAVLLSADQLADPEHDTIGLLREAARHADRLRDPELERSVYVRLVGELVVAGYDEEALEWYDRGTERVGELGGITREVILRSATRRALGEDQLLSAVGNLRFEVADPPAGVSLWVSADPREPFDEVFRQLPLRNGVGVVERALGTAPQRWVLRSAAGERLGSGTVWPRPGHRVEVTVTPRTPSPVLPEWKPRRRPGDGHRRLFLVVLDCADWRLVQYGRARGEMAVLDGLIRTGYRAVLDSYPPYTAVAMQALVQPFRRGVASFLGLVHHLGEEIEGLNFVGRNPAAPLHWLLPESSNLFTELGSGDLVTVNMLRAYGPLRFGRHAQVVGPRGAISQLAGYRATRPLQPEKVAFFGGVDDDADRRLLEEMAADFDTTVKLASERPDIDLLAVRVASLDLLTHGHFAAATATGQDDGRPLLHRVYAYMDRRLGDVDRALDADDFLVVMSDHGIRTALEHDRHALFVASGPGVSPGRAPGSPEIRGVGRMAAEMLGVETNWPATGIEAWVEALPGGRGRRAETVEEPVRDAGPG